MKKAANVLYLLFVILALGLTTLLIVRNYNNIVAGERTTFQSRYLSHQRYIESLFNDDLYNNDREFQNSLMEMDQEDKELEGLILLIPGKSIFFNHLDSTNKRLLEEFGTDQLDTGPDSILRSYKSLTHDVYSVPIRTELQENIQAFFIYETFSKDDIIQLLKFALIPVSFLFILTLVIIIIVSRNNKNENENFNEDPLFANISGGEIPAEKKIKNKTKTKDPVVDDDFLSDSNMEDSLDTSDMDFDLPDENNSDDMDFDLPSDSDDFSMDSASLPEEGDMDFDIPDTPELAEEGDMQFEIPDEGNEENLDNTDSGFSSDSEMDDFDFDLPEEDSLEEAGNEPEADLEMDDLSFDLPEEDNLEETTNEPEADLEMDDLSFDLPEEDGLEETTNKPEADLEMDDLSFDLPEEDNLEEAGTEAETDLEMDDLSFDLPEEDSLEETTNEPEADLEMDDLSFDLPEEDVLEETTNEPEADLEMDDLNFDLPEEDNLEEAGNEAETDPEMDDLSFDLPEGDGLEETTNEPEADLEMDDLSVDLPEEETEANGLYVAATGLSREDFFEDRLEQELNRASSNNENLVVSYIQLNDSNEENLKQMADKLKTQWDNPDLAFQWGDQGICLISQDSELTPLLEQLEEIYEDSGQQLRIGVSSRNGRLLSKDLLIEEARKALDRSSSDKPIIGFSADPEKFRAVVGQEVD